MNTQKKLNTTMVNLQALYEEALAELGDKRLAQGLLRKCLWKRYSKRQMSEMWNSTHLA